MSSSWYSPFPDAEAVASWALRNAGVSGGRVYSSIPATPTFPLIVVERIGGQPAERHRLDAARIQVSVWGSTKSEARSIADLARRTLHGIEGQTMTITGGAPVDAVITGIDDDLGLFWLPDNLTDRDRYIFAVQIFLHTP